MSDIFNTVYAPGMMFIIPPVLLRAERSEDGSVTVYYRDFRHSYTFFTRQERTGHSDESLWRLSHTVSYATWHRIRH